MMETPSNSSSTAAAAKAMVVLSDPGFESHQFSPPLQKSPPPPPPPPPYAHPPLMDHTTSASFTNTFLRGILTSLQGSKDPIVANAWLETLLDAIDILPSDIIRREIVPIAVQKGHLAQPNGSRKAACKLLGKVATKLDPLTVRQDILPAALNLCQDVDGDVRHFICRQLGFIARGVGLECTKSVILPRLIELNNDEEPKVRLAAVETIVHLLSLLDDETCTRLIVPLVVKSCETAKLQQDESLAQIAHYLGRLCHGLTPSLQQEQKSWFLDYFRHLSQLGIMINQSSNMPDLVPQSQDKSDLYQICRRECAFNFPAMILFNGQQNFVENLYPIFSLLASDPHFSVRRTLASSLHEVARLVGAGFACTKNEVCKLFADNHVEVLEAMVGNLVHVIDALARHGVLQFGQSGVYSEELSCALLKCETLVGQTRNWRLHTDCLEKFSCLANCISPLTVQHKFIPMLFDRALRARPLPCRQAAGRTLLVILRFTIKMEDRTRIVFRVREDLLRSSNCHARMLYLRLCEMAVSLFSKRYFKKNFFGDFLTLANDPVPNIRLKLCSLLPRLKGLLYLPSDRSLLKQLEETVKVLLIREKDRDVIFGVQKAIQELDKTEVGVDGVPSMDAEEDREDDRKSREERLISSMEEQMNKIQIAEIRSVSPLPQQQHLQQQQQHRKSFLPTQSRLLLDSQSEQRRRRSESLPPSLDRATPTAIPVFAAPTTMTSSFNGILPNPATASIKASTSSSTSSSYPAALPPFSSSLENLDPSAKEFLVDAGVTLDTTKLLSESLPNLNINKDEVQQQQLIEKSSSDGNLLKNNFSKILISNEEMRKYEAEYQKVSAEIAMQKAKQQQQQQQQQQSIQRESRPESRIRPPMTKVINNNTNSSNSSSSSSNLPRFRIPSKLSSSTDKLQGSIERLAEKWEAKRKSLDEQHQSRAAQMEQKLQLIKQQNSSLPNIHNNNTINHNNNNNNAFSSHHGSPSHSSATNLRRTSLLKTPQKRMSLTDQMGLKAVEKFVNIQQQSNNQHQLSIQNNSNKENSNNESEDEKSQSEDEGNKLSQKLNMAINAARKINKHIEETLQLDKKQVIVDQPQDDAATTTSSNLIISPRPSRLLQPRSIQAPPPAPTATSPRLPPPPYPRPPPSGQNRFMAPKFAQNSPKIPISPPVSTAPTTISSVPKVATISNGQGPKFTRLPPPKYRRNLAATSTNQTQNNVANNKETILDGYDDDEQQQQQQQPQQPQLPRPRYVPTASPYIIKKVSPNSGNSVGVVNGHSDGGSSQSSGSQSPPTEESIPPRVIPSMIRRPNSALRMYPQQQQQQQQYQQQRQNSQETFLRRPLQLQQRSSRPNSAPEYQHQQQPHHQQQQQQQLRRPNVYNAERKIPQRNSYGGIPQPHRNSSINSTGIPLSPSKLPPRRYQQQQQPSTYHHQSPPPPPAPTRQSYGLPSPGFASANRIQRSM